MGTTRYRDRKENSWRPSIVVAGITNKKMTVLPTQGANEQSNMVFNHQLQQVRQTPTENKYVSSFKKGTNMEHGNHTLYQCFFFFFFKWETKRFVQLPSSVNPFCRRRPTELAVSLFFGPFPAPFGVGMSKANVACPAVW